MSIIRVTDLAKSFRVFKRREGLHGAVQDLFFRNYHALNAVDRISFEVAAGEIVGFIGPNGAGKSTTIKMLTGILRPEAGDMDVLGFHPFHNRREYTKHIGVVFGQRTQLWWDIAVIESLKLLGSIYNVPPNEFDSRLAELDQVLELKEFLHTPVRKISLGQRIRADLAASLLHRPRVVFLDEPTIGLDAVIKDRVRAFMRLAHQKFETTILLTTHDLNEIEQLCKRIIIIDKGKIVFDGDLETIRSLPGLRKTITVDFQDSVDRNELPRALHESVELEWESDRMVKIFFDPSQCETARLLESLVTRFEVADLTVADPGIERVVRRIYTEGVACP